MNAPNLCPRCNSKGQLRTEVFPGVTELYCLACGWRREIKYDAEEKAWRFVIKETLPYVSGRIRLAG